jgi:hypothetical protein
MTPELVTPTETEVLVDPPNPVQERTKTPVEVRAAVVKLPEVDLLPLQPPLAVHPVAFVDDQLSVALFPESTFAGVATSDTTGAGAGAGSWAAALRGAVSGASAPQPQPAMATQAMAWAIQANDFLELDFILRTFVSTGLDRRTWRERALPSCNGMLLRLSTAYIDASSMARYSCGVAMRGLVL